MTKNEGRYLIIGAFAEQGLFAFALVQQTVLGAQHNRNLSSSMHVVAESSISHFAEVNALRLLFQRLPLLALQQAASNAISTSGIEILRAAAKPSGFLDIDKERAGVGEIAQPRDIRCQQIR